MENRGGPSGRQGGGRHGEAARRGGPGGRRGWKHNGELGRGPGHAAAGDPQGGPRNREESPRLGGEAGEGDGDGEEGWSGGRGRHNGDKSPRLGVPAGEGDVEEGTASGGGGPGGNVEQGRLRLGGPGDQSVQQATSRRRDDGAAGEDAGFPRDGVPARSDGRWQVRPDINASTGVDLGGASATSSKHPAAYSTVESEEKKLALPASATPTSTPLLPLSNFLSEALLSWTIKDVLNENLYKGKVNHIPSKFDSPDQFVAVYSGILIEETRSATCAAIQNLSVNPYCQLLSIGECDSPSLFYLDVDLPMTRSDEIQCDHIARDFDVCLLSSRCPRDSNLDITSCSTGLVVGIGRDEDASFQKSFRVLVPHYAMFQTEKIKFVIFLTNIKYNMEVAHILSLQDVGNRTAIEALLELSNTVEKRCKVCVQSLNYKDGMLSMNKKQGDDVISNLTSSVKCTYECHAEVVWAPPRSMKGCISALMKSFLNSSSRVLICLPSESCLVDFLMDIEDFLVPSDAFGDILVLNRIRGLGNCSNFESVFLENRSHELYCCLRLCKSLLRRMSSYLDLSGFYHSPRCPSSDQCERCNNQLLSFSVELFAERFTDIRIHLCDYLVYLVNSGSAICLPDEDRDSILELLQLMKQLEALLHNKDLRQDKVEEEFKLILATDAVDSADCRAKSLNEIRMSCIRLIAKLNNSLQLDQPENKVDVDKICIQHSRIIITSLDYTWKLHGQGIDAFDVLIVSGANQIKDSDMLLPLALPIRHIIFFGDQLHVQTFVHSKICKEAGFGRSIYERLQLLVPEKLTLTHQYVLHPLMLKIMNIYFYNGRLKGGANDIPLEANKEFESKLPFIVIVDVPSMQSSDTRKGRYINSAALCILLQQLISKDLINLDRKFSVCVVCLSSNETNTVGDHLGTMYEMNDRFDLQVKLVSNLEGNLFDVIIISTIIEDDGELNRVSKNSLNVALTSARHCCFMVDRSKTLVKSGGIWKDLVKYAKDLGVVRLVPTNELTQVMKKFEKDDADHISDPNCAFSRKIPQEFTWVNRPYRTKHILPYVRDQRGQPDTCTFQSSCGTVESLMKLHNANLSPPQECKWDLSVDDLKNKYEKSVRRKLMSEDKTDRGKRRLKVALETLKKNGVLGRNKTRTKSRIIKILLYEEVEPSETVHVTKLLEEGNIMVGHFRLSWNYFTLKPDEVYAFDEKKAFIHPKSDLVASHAVMMVGIGHQRTGPKRFLRHMVMQNSEGKLFGINGIGRVRKNTVRGLYRLEVEIPKEGLLD